MIVDIVSIFPDYLAPLRLSLLGRAREAGTLDIRIHDLRDWARDRHRTVDDAPFGGGAGMVMRPDVWGEAIDAVAADGGPRPEGPDGGAEPEPITLIIPTPAGRLFDQRLAQRLSTRSRIVIACGRYEGIDARVAEYYEADPGFEVLELSIGDYVLGGGEAAALVMVEAVARLLPGVLGNPQSLAEESHDASGLLEYPVYTRPATWRGLSVPAVLTSGDHGKVAAWRSVKSLERTRIRRPDLLGGAGEQ